MKPYIDAQGNYLGAWDGEPPSGAIEAPSFPSDARQPWLFPGWGPIPKSKQEVLDEINSAYQAEFAALEQSYPRAEIDSWLVQLREADAWEANPEAETPWLTAALAERNADGGTETMAEFVTKIRAKNAQYSALSGALSGKRQRLEKLIQAAKTPEELATVAW